VAERHDRVGLLDVRRGARLARDGDLDRVRQVGLGDRADGRRHGRGEEGDLAALGRLAEDLLDVLREAHAQHLVGLVEHEELHAVERQRVALHVVHDAAGRADDDVDAVAQRTLLRHVGRAAVDGQDAEAGQVRRERLDRVGDLHGELARRGQDECLDVAAGHVRARVDGGEQRDAERGGLAGAGLRDAGDVAAGEQRRDGARLDR
jgi:hypothetical protein